MLSLLVRTYILILNNFLRKELPGIAVLAKVALNMVVGMAVLENVILKSTFSWYTRSRQIYSVCILKLSQQKICHYVIQ